MTDLLYFLIYKFLCLTCGSFSIYLGYKLFVKGVFEKAGDLSFSYGTMKIILGNGLPGTFFSLAGTAIILFVVFKGFDLVDGGPNVEKAKIVQQTLFKEPLSRPDFLDTTKRAKMQQKVVNNELFTVEALFPQNMPKQTLDSIVKSNPGAIKKVDSLFRNAQLAVNSSDIDKASLLYNLIADYAADHSIPIDVDKIVTMQLSLQARSRRISTHD